MDPTADWPPAGEAPVLDFDRQSVGSLRLGDALEKARVLGRPERVEGSMGKGDLVLYYPSFELDFDDGRLACVSFVLEDEASVSCAGDIRLTRATRPLDVLAWFGDPASDTTDGRKLRWIDFGRAGATLALEFDEQRLGCVQLYAQGYA